MAETRTAAPGLPTTTRPPTPGRAPRRTGPFVRGRDRLRYAVIMVLLAVLALYLSLPHLLGARRTAEAQEARA